MINIVLKSVLYSERNMKAIDVTLIFYFYAQFFD